VNASSLFEKVSAIQDAVDSASSGVRSKNFREPEGVALEYFLKKSLFPAAAALNHR
jgi:hypothetical protein